MSQLAQTSAGSQYNDDDRRRAITEYAVSGHIPTVSKNLNIPESTLKDWRTKDWWDSYLVEIRHETKDLIDAKLQGLIVSGYEVISDRMAHGDHHLTKDGDIVRVPVKMRDVSIATGINFDKLRLLRNEPTSIRSESSNARLNSLADKIRELQAGSETVIEHQD